ncbi:MAG: PilZ domain-containing protein [Spirochaetaceae bacterium]|nr:MAG: PilZ domain-containing protein [Spirochaetaceae bacterium]
MKRVVIYTETLETGAIIPALADYEILRAASTREVARTIVERSGVIALIIEKKQIDEPFLRLLSSIKKSFPILRICLIGDPAAGKESAGSLPPDCRFVPAGDRIQEEVKAFISEIDVTDRRDHPRFDWPLQGSLSLDDRHWQTFNIWALSAEGAFLENRGSAPQQGSIGMLRISFQNCRLVTRCEIMDRRPPSTRLPAGFAVRFTMVSEDSMRRIDRIIQDALIQTLLEPDSEPEIPTLDDQDLSIPGFESF